MKRNLLTALLLTLSGYLFAQNNSPVISNLSTIHTPSSNQVNFIFDVADAENDNLDLQVRVSADSGKTWLVAGSAVVGDTGFPQLPGTGKSIVWSYDPFQLASQVGPGSVAFQARIIADDRQGVDIQSLVDQVDSARLVQSLLFVEGVRHRTFGTLHLQEVRDSISDLMADLNLVPDHQVFSFGGISGFNYIARRSGLLNETRTYLASGHYDTVSNSPGADDNGTATAGLMEIMRILAPLEYRNSIRFLAFDLEEAGLRGSIAYVTNHIPDWEETLGLLNMEMIGYKDETANSQSLPVGFNLLFPDAFNQVIGDSSRGNFLTNVANTASNDLKDAFDSCATAYVPDLRVISLAAPGTSTVAPDLRRSDHAPFWDAGYQALMLTDAADLRNPNYHSTGDSVGTLDLQFYVQSTKAILATLAKLADPLHADVTVSDTFVIGVPVGTTDELSSTVSVYPNPAVGAFKAEFQADGIHAVRFELLDLQGKRLLVKEDAVVPAGQQIIEFDGGLDHGGQLTPGIYLLVWQVNGVEGSQKIVWQ